MTFVFIKLFLFASLAFAELPLKSFIWRDQIIGNYGRFAKFAVNIGSIAEAESLKSAALKRNLPDVMGWLSNYIRGKDAQERYAVLFRIDDALIWDCRASLVPTLKSPKRKGELRRHAVSLVLKTLESYEFDSWGVERR